MDAALAGGEGGGGGGDGGGGALDERYEAEALGGDAGASAGDAWNLYSNGSIQHVVALPEDGDYLLSARAYGQQAGDEPVRMSLLLDGQAVTTFEVTAVRGTLETYEAQVSSTRGNHVIAVAFENDYYDAGAGADRNLIVDWLGVQGPLGGGGAEPASTTRARIMSCDPAALGEDACARQILSSFARRAWRRPVQDEEVDRLLELLTLARQQGDGFEQGIRLALHAVLVSPSFLFRVEHDSDPAAPDGHPLEDHELASRLSYFVWSSMPDDELLAAADAGDLQQVTEVEAQVRRMLEDDRARSLVDNFAGQWLHTRNLAGVQPDFRDGHHSISHHGGQQANTDRLQLIDTCEIEQLAYLLERMRAVAEPTDEAPEATLLDSAAVFSRARSRTATATPTTTCRSSSPAAVAARCRAADTSSIGTSRPSPICSSRCSRLRECR